MVRRDPDDLITALSKSLKNPNPSTIRFTFKRGGLWQTSHAKAHSKKAKNQIRDKLKNQALNNEDKQWPLIARYRQNNKEQKIRFNCQAKIGRGKNFIQSLISVFRVNFFKKRAEETQKIKLTATKANPNSKTSLRKKKKTQINRQRRLKRLQIKQNKRKNSRANKL